MREALGLLHEVGSLSYCGHVFDRFCLSGSLFPLQALKGSSSAPALWTWHSSALDRILALLSAGTSPPFLMALTRIAVLSY